MFRLSYQYDRNVFNFYLKLYFEMYAGHTLWKWKFKKYFGKTNVGKTNGTNTNVGLQGYIDIGPSFEHN